MTSRRRRPALKVIHGDDLGGGTQSKCENHAKRVATTRLGYPPSGGNLGLLYLVCGLCVADVLDRNDVCISQIS